MMRKKKEAYRKVTLEVTVEVPLTLSSGAVEDLLADIVDGRATKKDRKLLRDSYGYNVDAQRAEPPWKDR